MAVIGKLLVVIVKKLSKSIIAKVLPVNMTLTVNQSMKYRTNQTKNKEH
jgi:hypothetical protein